MRPALLAAVLAAAVAVVAVRHRNLRPAEVAAPTRHVAAAGALRAGPCPDGTLPDEGVCIPVPSPVPPRRESEARADRLPRRADRPEDYAAYRLPVGSAVARTEAAPSPDGGAALGGVLLDAAPGAPVTVPTLEGQDGAATVVFAGRLFGSMVVTMHRIASGGRKSVVLVIIGHLADVPPLAPGQEVGGGTALGATGSQPLYLETRLVRTGVDTLGLPPDQLRSDATTILVDPRNVLARK